MYQSKNTYVDRIRHKDQLIYGAVFLFWGIISYIEVGAYDYSLGFTITIQLITSVITIMAIGSTMEKFKPESLLTVQDL